MRETDAACPVAIRNRVGHFTLSGPSPAAPGIHATLHQLQQQLAAWEHDSKVLAVVLRMGSEGVAWSTVVDPEDVHELGLCIGSYGKPILALVDGTLCFAALRLLQGATLRTVSERTSLRMDHSECCTDAVPDPILSRLPGALRNYLSLTARPLRPADALYAGLADYCLPSEMITEFDRCLDGMDWTTHPREALRTLLATLATPRMPGAELKALHLAIDEHFAFDSLEAIHASLKNESRPAYLDWADETIALLERHRHHAVATLAEQRRRDHEPSEVMADRRATP